LLRGPSIPDQVLAALPKTDLHCHLDGSLRLETFQELGRRVGLDVPNDPQLTRSRFFPPERESCQHEFLAYFRHTVAALQESAHLERVARELAEDAARDGCWYLEVRFCPLLHTESGLTPDEAVAAVRRGLDAAGQRSGIRSGIIITGIRTIAPSSSLVLAQLAVRWKGRGVVAFDLAGAEEDNPAKNHLAAFHHVMNNNQNVTIHAGEGFGPGSIHQALHTCGANRIGHGTRLHEAPDLMAYVNDHRIPLEVCLSSTVQSCVVSSVDEHPLRRYLDHGLRICLNTDNTLFASTTPLRELRLAVDTFDLTLLETENLVLNGFKSAFVPEQQTRELVFEALATFASLRDKYDLDTLVPSSM
jgi:adenosine deaminase